jgi:Cu+-exporting ATPase
MASQHLRIPISGMTCASCSLRIEKVLGRRGEVQDAAVNFAGGFADVTMNPQEASWSDIADAIRKAGYDVVLEEVTLPVEGMTCASCVQRVERLLTRVPGVLEAAANLAAGSARVRLMAGTASWEDLARAVAAGGYRVPARAESEGEDWEERRHALEYGALKSDLFWAAVFTVPVLVLSMGYMILGFPRVPGLPWILLGLSIPVQFGSGRRFLRSAWINLLHLTSDMNTLVSVGTLAAFATSVAGTLWPGFFAARSEPVPLYYDTACVIITLILFGRTLEARAKGKTSQALKALMDLSPKIAHRVGDGSEEDIPVAAVTVGSLLRVRPGEQVPVDGAVVEGRSALNESMLTGEMEPQPKGPGDSLFAGTLNTTGSVVMRAERVGRETFLSQIVEMVRSAQGSKAPIQRLADRVASVFVPVVLGAAALTFVLWMALAPEQAFSAALTRTVAVLIVACPCALGLATPTALMVGTGRAARMGILIRDAASLEDARRISAVVLDKTGTVTEGRPRVTDVRTLAGQDPSELLEWVASAESPSEHPLGRAVVDHAKSLGISLSGAEDFSAEPGLGVRALVGARSLLVGSEAFLRGKGVDTLPLKNLEEELESEGKTTLLAAVNGTCAGIVAASDTIRPEAARAVSALKQRSIEVIMLTGDREAAARAVAGSVGIDRVVASVMPDRKASEIERLQKEGRVVAMVGDGINDAPALARADLGMAMASGTDVAKQAAGITLVRPDLRLVPMALALSRATLRNIRQNLFWAFAYNVVGIPVAAGALVPFGGPGLSPVLAAFIMALSSVFVVSNALRLRRVKLN